MDATVTTDCPFCIVVGYKKDVTGNISRTFLPALPLLYFPDIFLCKGIKISLDASVFGAR
jgi:hypothetical protein